MKNIKYIALVFAFIAMLPMGIFAQKSICKDEECVFKILEKFKSNDQAVVDEAENEIGEIMYHIKFIGDYEAKTILKKTIMVYVQKFPDSQGNDYIFALMPQIFNGQDVDRLFRLVDNEQLADAVIRTVADMPNTSDHFEKYIVKNPNHVNHKAALAYAIGKQHIESMEEELISWIKDADDKTKLEIYNSLLVIGSSEKTTAIIEKGAKKLYKSNDVYIKIGAMRLLAAMKGEKSLPIMYKSLKNNNELVRHEAFELMKPYADDKVCAKTVKICKKGDRLIEVLDWLGEIKNSSQNAFVIKNLSSENPLVVEAAIRAVFEIDIPEGIEIVKPMFGGKHQAVIKEEMIKYEGNYWGVLNDVLRGDDKQKLAGLQILEARPTELASSRVQEALNSGNKEVRDEAYKVLRYVVAPAHGEFLSGLLESCDDKYVEYVQIAIKSAMANAPVDMKDNFASTLKHVKPETMPRYYKVFAYFGTELTVNKLIDAYNAGNYQEEAREALLLVENDEYKAKIDEVLKH